MATTKRKPKPAELKGWQQIAQFLGQPVATAQRWAQSGMPVRRQGRYVVTSAEELRRWLGQESGAGAVHIATGNADLAADLQRGLSEIRRQRRIHRVK